MALSKKPVNGMKDILPAEMEIRDYVTGVIKETYRSFGLPQSKHLVWKISQTFPTNRVGKMKS